MPRTEEAEIWFSSVYTLVQLIPPGRVTSYGHIAALLGEPKRPRQVGIALKHLPTADSGQFFHAANVPWQRVVNARGMISHRGPGSAARQAERLRDEGVTVDSDSMGEFYVDFGVVGWFPAEIEMPEGDVKGDEDEDEAT
ncbi:MGMT family protein [Aspergillus stella-maris]|uniref:MGMT family protein n=1 Tax=Aspergillus stella-maris TaxID=1810926 RepID=UPI003CCCCDCF